MVVTLVVSQKEEKVVLTVTLPFSLRNKRKKNERCICGVNKRGWVGVWAIHEVEPLCGDHHRGPAVVAARHPDGVSRASDGQSGVGCRVRAGRAHIDILMVVEEERVKKKGYNM